MKIRFILIMLLAVGTANAQSQSLQFFRPNHKMGLHVFEPAKTDTIPFTRMRVRVGGNFAQDFQSLRHQNSATPVYDAKGVDLNRLVPLTAGFNLAMANLNVDAQLGDGIRMNLTMYLSSRHHPETWVKGGYIQFDKLAFLNSNFVDDLMKDFTIKVGDYEVDYGDQHYRRTDGGNAIHNPFVENYIMDAFTTEVGGELYYHPDNGIIAMVGITNGQLNPTVLAPTKIDSATGRLNKYSPAFHAKLGYDKQFTADFRARLTASVYALKSTSSNTLFSGDRTGSHYFLVMENTLATAEANFRSGRFNPLFSQQVATFVINPFVKYKGIELFGTYEMANGRTITEKNMRSTTQYAVDLIYRFPARNENFWVGGRYNSLTAELPGNPVDVSISRAVGSLGWFVTKNIMLKGEYVSQVHNNFPRTDIRSGGKFDGLVMQAVVGF